MTSCKMYTPQFVASDSKPVDRPPGGHYQVQTLAMTPEGGYRSGPGGYYEYQTPMSYPYYSYQLPQGYIMTSIPNQPMPNQQMNQQTHAYQFVNSNQMTLSPSEVMYTKPVNFPIHQLSSTGNIPPALCPAISNLYHTIQIKKYATSALDPVRNYLTAYEYTIHNQWIIWDYETGFVHLTGMWKAAEAATRVHLDQVSSGAESGPKSKADIVKLLDSTPRQYHQLIKRIRGGFLKIQGTWLPYNLCKVLARRFCYHIRYELIPLFGNDFPDYCLTPNDPKFGELKFDEVESTGGRLFDIMEASQCLKSLGTNPLVPPRTPMVKHHSAPSYPVYSQTEYNQSPEYPSVYQTLDYNQPSRSQENFRNPSVLALEQDYHRKLSKYESLTPLKTERKPETHLKTPEVNKFDKLALVTPGKECKSYFEIPKSNGQKFELKTPASVTSGAGSPVYLKSPIAFQTGSFGTPNYGSNSQFGTNSLEKYSMETPLNPNYVMTPNSAKDRKRTSSGLTDLRPNSICPKDTSPYPEKKQKTKTHEPNGPVRSTGSNGGRSNGLTSLLIAANLPGEQSPPCNKARKVSMKINDLLT